MKDKYEFTTSSGNRCIATVAGRAGKRIAIDASWETQPSQADIQEYETWFFGNHPEYAPSGSQVIENVQARAEAFSEFLYGGGRN